MKLAAAALLMTATLAGCAWRGHPRDAELITHFEQNKTKFETLLNMFLSDKRLGRVAPDFVRGDDGHSTDSVAGTERSVSEIRKLCAELGITNGVEGYGDKSVVWFHSSALGLSISGSGKGYAYCKNKPDLVVESLDNYRAKESFTAFRKIDGNWYLYLDYED